MFHSIKKVEPINRDVHVAEVCLAFATSVPSFPSTLSSTSLLKLFLPPPTPTSTNMSDSGDAAEKYAEHAGRANDSGDVHAKEKMRGSVPAKPDDRIAGGKSHAGKDPAADDHGKLGKGEDTHATDETGAATADTHGAHQNPEGKSGHTGSRDKQHTSHGHGALPKDEEPAYQFESEKQHNKNQHK